MKIQKKCKVKGCATAAYCKGMCNRHYKYFYSHGYVKEITVNDNNKIDVRGTVARIHLRNHQGQTTKVAPSTIVKKSQNSDLPRWFSRSAWCEIVSVTPELSSSAVLIVGSQKGLIVWKAGTTPAGPRLGQVGTKFGQSSRR